MIQDLKRRDVATIMMMGADEELMKTQKAKLIDWMIDHPKVNANLEVSVMMAEMAAQWGS